ncbi:hypothetical protein [Thalassotalea crassostreae]|uniref:hypothetical protein n=1 Tax=Thalassotalea crassostreae TaxID=1763536 RepID=UPI000838ED9C|nr:hypothetical protein [Thalassotalea crassostreae]
MTLLLELKRRNVFKVAIAYIVVSWLTVQVVNSIVPIIEAPEWVAKVVLILLLVGFPIACLFAWAFELTPQGIKRSSEVDLSDSITTSTSRKIDFIIIGALILIIGGLVYTRVPTPSYDIEASNNAASIAVLPFINMSSDPEQEYFSDGISEEILNVLVRIDGLAVTSRTSSFAFKGSNKSIGEIANTLEVNHVLEGSVRKAGTKIRITAQLIDATTDKHLWSETYERKLNDVFIIQDEIANAIVNSLHITLGGSQSTQNNLTDNLEAYNLFLQGKYEYAKRAETPEALLTAIDLFEQAVKLDPNFSTAYAYLGITHALISNYDLSDSNHQQINLARLSTNKALKLQPNNVLALLGSALIKYQFEADFEGADKQFNQALAIEPNNSILYNFYGDFLSVTMNYQKAFLFESKAAELDAGSMINISEHAEVLNALQKYNQAYQIYKKAVLKWPDEHYMSVRMAMNYFYAENFEQGFALADKIIKKWPDKRKHFLWVGQALQGDANAIEKLKEHPIGGNSFINQNDLAIAALYYKDKQFDDVKYWFDRYYANGVNYYDLLYSPMFNPELNTPPHTVIEEIYSRPGINELIRVRKENIAKGLHLPK